MKIGISGMGKVGCSLQRSLKLQGITAICAPGMRRQKLEPEEAAEVTVGSLINLLQKAQVIFLTVPDSQIKQSADNLVQLAQQEQLSLTSKTFFHCSGAGDVALLQSLAQAGANIGSWHPLQSFANGQGSFKDIYIALDGQAAVRKIGEQVARLLGSYSFYVPPQARRQYHAAACLTSNYIVTLLAIAQALLAKWTVSEAEALQALLPLLRGTVANLEQVTLARKALTGPIARGDLVTVKEHLSVLPPATIALYKALGSSAAQLALANGTIESNQYHELEHLFRN
ncbi:MAG TPA: DUF2520 domain-containing protein [Candidatus Avacidaminococcus intestinavium]|uniref:DUF2520 domain-containing protein n=1 Tax=Candidatus Avacidaminococcus intestinavium TaxID=2840684 RepID=A0A9D1SLE1_9FIRM|nr:DUF2520 domain-containing protein [Candidatus Avacidaminococcus intestinavium]